MAVDTLSPVPPLTAAALVCAQARADIAGAGDVVQLVSDFADTSCAPYWSLPRACLALDLRLAQRIAAREPPTMNRIYKMHLLNEALKAAVSTVPLPEDADKSIDDPFGDKNMEVVEWLCTSYCPWGPVTKAVVDAAHRGSLRILTWLKARPMRILWRNDCANLAAASGYLDVLQWLVSQDVLSNQWVDLAFVHAAKNGHLHVLQWLLEQGHEIEEYRAASQHAVASGHLEVLKFLVETFSPLRVSGVELFPLAAQTDDLVMLEYLFELFPKVGLPQVMATAAAYGHLRVLKWLHENHEVRCTVEAMDDGAANGRLEVVQWLHENRTEGCTTTAMNDAAANGHLEVVQWLHEHRTEGCTFRAMNNAAQGGHLDVLKWLHANRTEGCTIMAMTMAASRGHLDVVQWLHDTCDKGCTSNALMVAAEGGHLDVLKWLSVHRELEWTTDVMDAASTFEVLEWPHATRIEGCTSRAFEHAAEANNFVKALFLLENYRNVGATVEAIRAAILSDHIEMFLFLDTYYPDLWLWSNAKDIHTEHSYWDILLEMLSLDEKFKSLLLLPEQEEDSP